jgi:hypothetical protein
MEPTRRKKAMTIAPSRVEGHRRFLEKASKVGGVISARSASEYLAILDDYSALKAENERFTKENKQMRDSTAKEIICCRCGKETLFYTIAPYGSVDDGDPICAECFDGGPQDWKARAIKAEAELARQAPLIEAVMGVGINQLKAGVGLHTVGMCRPILAAALALREEKK